MNLNMFFKSFALLALVCVLPQVSFAGKKALVIIDMQDDFATNRGTERKFDNPEKLAKISENQKEMIDAAKRNGMPIILVEYANWGPTNKALRDAIDGHPKVQVIEKHKDGLFDDPKSKEIAQSALKNWNITHLLVMGANGDSCVKKTIKGALKLGYKVWAFNSGIADFNSDQFQYPYSYKEHRSWFPNPFHPDVTAYKGYNEFKKAKDAVDFRKRPRD